MYPMTIDQVNNRIFNVDSMAYGSDISKVTTSVYGVGTIGYKYLDEPEVMYLWSSHDSIDFTRQLQFIVKSTDETYTRTYDIDINVRKVFPDSLLWTGADTVGFPVLSGIMSVVRNDSIFCFGTDTAGVPSVSYRSVANGSWNGVNHISGFAADGWSHRVTLSNGQFITVSNGSLYSSSDALNWNSVKAGIKSVILSGEDYGELWAISQDSNIVKFLRIFRIRLLSYSVIRFPQIRHFQDLFLPVLAMTPFMHRYGLYSQVILSGQRLMLQPGRSCVCLPKACQ
jgi:hypothetical protein